MKIITEFKANGKTYPLDMGLRSRLKAGWDEMLKPSKSRIVGINPSIYLPMLTRAEKVLEDIGESLVGKNILEAGCGYGDRCYLMAKYEGTRVHGIDVDEYTVNQSPDVNTWNPADVRFVHKKIEKIRKDISKKFPWQVSSKVSFDTIGMDEYETKEPHDVIVSFDVLEHILDLESAFDKMNKALKPGGIMCHEYNPFFSINGGHSLCTLDFYFGHCVLGEEDFRRYIRELRPDEEKIAINFYTKCLNRATKSDIKELSTKYGFEIVKEVNTSPFTANHDNVLKGLNKEILPDVVKIYPTVTVDDLMYSTVNLVMRKK